MPGITLAAFLGAALTSALVSAIAARGRTRINDVLLAGIAVTLAATAFSTAAQYLADSRALFAAAQWSLGQLPQVGYDGVLSLVPFCSVSLAGLLILWRPLQVLSIDEELAHAEGVNVRAVRVAALGLGSLGVAACVAWCGPIAFVGLIVPHLVRLSLGAHLLQLLPMSALLGAAFLVACDTLARLLVPGREIPVGVVTAALGAPTLLWLVLRKTPA
jgi:iron complex transport system permease protein